MSHRLQGYRPISFSWGLMIFGALILSPAAAFAQNSSTRADIARSQTDVIATDHAPPSPNDEDLGEQAILTRSESYQPFQASFGLPAYYTSNVALSRSHEQDDFLAAPVVALSFQPRLTPTLYAFAMVREQLFYYDRFDQLNFGSFDAEAGLVYLVPAWHDLVFRAMFWYNRLTEKDSFYPFFQNYSIFVSAEIPFRIGQSQQLTLGVDANISLEADPEPPRRHDYETYFGYSIAITQALSFDAIARLTVRQYQLTDRVDVSESLAASANYSFNKWLSASAISTIAANQSNHSEFDYKVANVGGLLSINLRF